MADKTIQEIKKDEHNSNEDFHFRVVRLGLSMERSLSQT